MKKLSFSLFAILAIVFAVASAFSTKQNASKFTTTYLFYGLTPDALDNNLPSLPTVNQVTSNGTLFYSTSSNISIDQAFANTAASDGCNADDDHLCAAKIRDIDGTKTVLSAKEGDYHAN